MTAGLDVIIVDDDPDAMEVAADIINRFYVWGEVYVFSNVDEALEYCLIRDSGIAVFVVDVFIGDKTGYMFLDSVADRFPSIYDDTIMVTGNASDEVVNTCVASGINHLLEKPVRAYALQLAIRSIVSRYLTFSQKLLKDPEFASAVSGLTQ